jgi:hypothetical protein
MYNACSKISYRPVRSLEDLLPCLTKWINNKNSVDESSSSSSSSPKIKILSSSLIKMKSTVESIESVAVAVIENPTSLSEQEKNQIYKLTLPYTTRAFKQDFATISDSSIKEHLDHTTQGNFLFVALPIAKTEEEKENSDLETIVVAPKVVFHLLCSTFMIKNSLADENDKNNNNNNEVLAMCCSAFCCDPTFQNGGLATIVHTAALEFLRPKLIIMRTVNPSMLKLLKRTSPVGSKLFPNDCKTEEDWALARAIAKDAISKWDHLSAEVEKYDETKLVFRGVYKGLDEVFNKTSNPAKEQEQTVSTTTTCFEDIFVEPGDAQLRIMMFSS